MSEQITELMSRTMKVLICIYLSDVYYSIRQGESGL